MPAPGPNNIGANLWDQATQGSDHTLQRGQPPMIPGGPNGVIYGPEGIVCADETGQLWIKQSGPESNTGWVEASTGGGGFQPFTWEPTSITAEQFWVMAGIMAYQTTPGFSGVTSLTYEGVTNEQGLDLERGDSMISFSAPNLTTLTGNAYFYFKIPSLAIIDFPALVSVLGNVSSGAENCTSLTSANFPLLLQVGGSLTFAGNTSLSDLAFPSLEILAGVLNLNNCALSEDSVNRLLAMLVACTTDGVTPWGIAVFLDGGTNAAPTGQGILDAATLTGRGATVTTN